MFNLIARRTNGNRVRATLKAHRGSSETSGVLWIRGRRFESFLASHTTTSRGGSIVATSPDYSPVCSPDHSGLTATSLDSLGPIPIGSGAAADLFYAAKAAEGASPRTVEWYQMILVRAVRRFAGARPVDAIAAADLRTWFLEHRATLAPGSIAG